MRSSDLRVRLLAVIGATGLASAALAACGSESTTTGSTLSDAAGERGDERGDVLGADADATPPDVEQPDSAGNEGGGSPRRPFLVGASLRSAASEVRDDWGLPHGTAAVPGPVPSPHRGGPEALPVDPATARELARAWLTDALEEHASIAAFARFTMMLLSVGAPPELVVASQRASIEEVAHARDCFALAQRYDGGRPVGPGVLEVHDALGPWPGGGATHTLADLAALTTEEGCIGETLGVALASEQLALAQDPQVRRVLARIVKDETRHAELAWKFVAWAIAEEQRGSARATGVSVAVARAAKHAIAVTRAMIIRPAPADLAAWHAHGRLTCAEARDASERAIQDVVLPCLGALTRDISSDDASQPLLHDDHRLSDQGRRDGGEILESGLRADARRG